MSTCPRCGEAFGCGAGEPTPCWCVSHTLDDATLAALRERYDACLCPACLAAEAAGPFDPPVAGREGPAR